MRFNNFIIFYSFITIITGIPLHGALTEQTITPEEAMYTKNIEKGKARVELVAKEICDSTPISSVVTKTIIASYLVSHFIKTTEFDLSKAEKEEIMRAKKEEIIRHSPDHFATSLNFSLILKRTWLPESHYALSANLLKIQDGFVFEARSRTYRAVQTLDKECSQKTPFSIFFESGRNKFNDKENNLVKHFNPKGVPLPLFGKKERSCCSIDNPSFRTTILSQIEPDIIFPEDTTEATSD